MAVSTGDQESGPHQGDRMRSSPGRRLVTLNILGLVVLVAACSTGGPSPAPASTTPSLAVSPEPLASVAASDSPTPSRAADPLAQPVIDGAFDVGNGRKLYLQCWGDGSPTIILEGGHPGSGLDDYARFGEAFTSRLASERRVCAYDRAGYGRSDPAPDERPRQLEDVHADLRALLEAAAIEGPYVLVGSSFGGFIVTTYASRFPEDVVGVVTLDTPAPTATLTLDDIPELAWDHPENPERLDVIGGFEGRLAGEKFPFSAPLLVVTASGGDSSVEDQAFWLDWSRSSRQIELDGGHEVYVDQPEAVADEVLAIGE
jgi:alpha/beta hydrolase fold